MSNEYPDWAIPGGRMTSIERKMYIKDIARVKRETAEKCRDIARGISELSGYYVAQRIIAQFGLEDENSSTETLHPQL